MFMNLYLDYFNKLHSVILKYDPLDTWGLNNMTFTVI